MAKKEFFAKRFDEGTLTKLELFERYTREWLPVFLSSPARKLESVHVYDFFAGPGANDAGEPGSPLRALTEISHAHRHPDGPKVFAHFFDEDSSLIDRLRSNIAAHPELQVNVTIQAESLDFRSAIERCRPTLESPSAAKLVFIDQFGVEEIQHEVFTLLVDFPRCDFMFFIASATLNRFRDHPAIKLKIARPDDSHHVHLAVLDYYRDLIPPDRQYCLAPFSIKKKGNIYGVIFGSAHLLGLDKFLQTAWKLDPMNGEANFDIHRDNVVRGQARLDLPEFKLTKVKEFEDDLEAQVRTGLLNDEFAIARFCLERGMLRQHAKPVLQRLKRERVLDLEFTVPQIKRASRPRTVKLIT